MSLPDFVNQSNVSLTDRVSGFFGNETKHDNLVTSVEDMYNEVKEIDENIKVLGDEIRKDAEQIHTDAITIKENAEQVLNAADDTKKWRDEAVDAAGIAVTAKDSAVIADGSAQSSAANAKLSETAADSFAHDAKLFANSALISEEESKRYYNMSYGLYEDLVQGQVYRGIWNPHTEQYPDAQGTNSVWDVVLNENELEFTWNGIKWYWGDRLIYIHETGAYQQVESGLGGGVVSVNGKKGAVVLNSGDVGAVPITRKVNNKVLSADVTLNAADVGAYSKTEADDKYVTKTTTVNAKPLSSNVTLNASDVGAVSKSGDTMTAPLTISTASGLPFIMDSTSSTGPYILGKSGNVNDWMVGRANDAGDVGLSSYKHGTNLIIRTDKVQANKDLYVGNNKVSHAGNIIGSVASGAVIERGSNSNGEWVKFQDGTMICTRDAQVDPGPLTPYVSLYQAPISWTYPQPFISQPSLSGTVTRHSSATWITPTYTRSGVTGGFRIFDVAAAASGVTVCDTSLMAVGRWK